MVLTLDECAPPEVQARIEALDDIFAVRLRSRTRSLLTPRRATTKYAASPPIARNAAPTPTGTQDDSYGSVANDAMTTVATESARTVIDTSRIERLM